MSHNARKIRYGQRVLIPADSSPLSIWNLFARADELVLRSGILAVVVALCQPAIAEQKEANFGPDITTAVDDRPSPHVPNFEGSLTLDEVLGLASVRNPRIVAKRKELGIADGELRQASIYFQNNPEVAARIGRRRVPASSQRDTSIGRAIELYPSLGVSVGFDQSSDLSPTRRFTEFDVEVSQQFEVFGQPHARKEAFTAARESVLADIATTEWEVLAMVRSEYYAVQIAMRRLELFKGQFGFGNSLLGLARRQFDEGEIARTDYRQFEIQMANLKTQMVTAESDLSSARVVLQLSIGADPAVHIDLAQPMQAPTGMALSDEVYLAEVLRVYPRLRHSHTIIEQREREFALIKKEGKPNFNGMVFYREEDDNERVFGVGLSIPLPLFNRKQGSRAAAKAAIDVAQYDTNYVEAALRAQARNALTRLRSTQESASYYDDEILPAIETNLEQLDNTFRQGEIGMLELRVNQRDLFIAQAAAVDVLGNYYQARAVAEGLLGRDIISGASTDPTRHEETPNVP